MLKALNYFELKSYLLWLESRLLGAQLQDSWTNGQHIVLEFYQLKSEKLSLGGTVYLIFDLQNQFPAMVLTRQKPSKSKTAKPLILFLNAHVRNLRLTEIYADKSKGRIVDLWFEGGEKKCHCEVSLIPRAANMMVTDGQKKIFYHKPREFPPAHQLSDELQVGIETDWQHWCEQWLAQQQKGAPSGQKSPVSAAKVIEKKSKALQALQQSLDSAEEQRWRRLGEALKLSNDLPDDLRELFDEKLTRAANKERAFQKAKDIVRKKEGTQKRIETLRAEIEQISARGLLEKKDSSLTRLLRKTDSKGRKLVLGDGTEAVIGKSGADNLTILRQARAWDLWLHLKDYPGAHAIIFHDKSKHVTPGQIEQVARWVIAESRKISLAGKYDVVVVECRFVRPIKGDKLGRVTYTHPRHFTFSSKT